MSEYHFVSDERVCCVGACPDRGWLPDGGVYLRVALTTSSSQVRVRLPQPSPHPMTLAYASDASARGLPFVAEVNADGTLVECSPPDAWSGVGKGAGLWELPALHGVAEARRAILREVARTLAEGASRCELGSAEAGPPGAGLVELTFTALDRDLGTPRVLCAGVDLTARRREEAARAATEAQLAAERHLNAAILENAPTLVIVMDREGRIRRFNRGAEQLSGYCFAEVEGRFPWDVLLPPDVAERVRREAFEGGRRHAGPGPTHYRNEWRCKSGERRLLEWQNTMIPDALGADGYMVSVGIDVTETHAAAERLRASEERLLRAERYAGLGSWEWDMGTNVFAGSPEFFRISGLEGREGLLPADAWNGVFPDDRARVAAWIQEARRTGEPPSIEYRIVRGDGAVRWVRGGGRGDRDAEGRVRRLTGYQQDITEEREALEQLHLQDAALESATNGVIILTLDGTIAYANPALARIWSVGAAAEMVGRPAAEFVSEPQQLETMIANLIRAGAIQREMEVQRKDGTRLWLDLAASIVRRTDGAPGWMMASVVDVTERRLVAGLQQRLSTDFVRLAGSAYFDAVCAHLHEVLDVDVAYMAVMPSGDARRGQLAGYAGRYEWNDRGATIDFTTSPGLGLREGDVCLVADDVQARFPASQGLANIGARGYAAIGLFNATGTQVGHVGVAHAAPLRSPSLVASLLKLAAVPLAAEWERQRAQARFQNLFEFGTDAIVFVDAAGTITDANRQAERLFGYRRAELVGRGVDVLVPPAIRAGHVRLREGFWREPEGRRVGGSRSHLAALRQDGSTVPVDITLTKIEADGESTVVAMVQDRSEHEAAERERRTLEAQLLRAQKMDAIGTLAAGIAHDFNNILAGILGIAELAQHELGNIARTQRAFDEIRRAGRRAADLVNQILTFSRQQPGVRAVVSPPAIVEEVVRFLRASIPSGVSLHLTVAGQVPDLVADASQLHQVLVNLCTNAWHALEGREGRIDVEVACATVPALTPAGVRPGRYVTLVVRDDGTGMDAATVQRMFEPFFTTKEPGRGTGLGLSVVHGIVKSHGGAIDVVSAPGRGTSFTVFLPVPSEVTPGVEGPAPPRPVANRPGRILMVDDEELLLEVAAHMLRERGHEVRTFTSAPEALEEARTASERYDLVVTDLNLPGVSGITIARAVAARAPGVPVVVTSGYLDTETLAAANLPNVARTIGKPYGLSELADLVVDVLSAGRKGTAADPEGRGA